MVEIEWTDYLRYRAKLRGFDLERIEVLVRFGTERYHDSATGREVVIGKHTNVLVLVAYESNQEGAFVPVTIHATTRQQISLRLKSGRYRQ